jgi:S-adenosylmethionine:tRNA ribosyltransferase-isomerase
MTHVLSDFDFHLPQALIAQEPARPRDASRVLVYERSSGRITDDVFRNIGTHLQSDTMLVMNNSKVEKARLVNSNSEIFVLRQINPTDCEALVRPGRRFKPGKTIHWADGVDVETLAVADDGVRTLRLSVSADSPVLAPYRRTPLPPYITPDESLSECYQTVYAKPEGSKAAPTAGLHFTDDLLSRLRMRHEMAEVTLHVGLGTFAPVKSESITHHVMHSEWYSIDSTAAAALNGARHITAVGTTTTRVLETACRGLRRFEPTSGDTSIFITPGYEWKAVDSLITNFHLPKSTLLMLVAALTGVDELHRIYGHAIREGYRFYSFGDAMLIL